MLLLKYSIPYSLKGITSRETVRVHVEDIGDELVYLELSL